MHPSDHRIRGKGCRSRHRHRARYSGSVSVESVFPRLEPLLPRISKPVQYVGGELNATVKDWDAASVRWALMYPDAYEVGLPNQGVMILYEILNELPDVLAERTYAVWPDLEKLMREHDVPQFTVDGHRPLKAFDLMGISFATELGYTNMLTALDLAGIPIHAADSWRFGPFRAKTMPPRNPNASAAASAPRWPSPARRVKRNVPTLATRRCAIPEPAIARRVGSSR